MTTWGEGTRSQVPDSSLVEDVLEAAEQIPGLQAWVPAAGAEPQWLDVLVWGLTMLCTQPLGGTERVNDALSGRRQSVQ